ncbi:TIGR00730 family Rossman fold protein [Salipaludibacillus daqingensis]|uniref:LOG family protein n=1 Tax=Salipaludibacillus daqingensis TaxID=3041001 RepID=UPI002475413E|nr:TIGR00730 family Rossman fold protein [Salipaludibacillus daqingensis]
MKSMAVFCGSSEGHDPIYMEKAKEFGTALAEEGWQLVYGGARVGCMGAMADAVLEAGGEVIGVMPEKLMENERAHEHLTTLHTVQTIHERKAMMMELSDGLVAFPGGTGTLEEWFEAFTWGIVGFHSKPCGVLNINGYYGPLISLLDHMVAEGFASEAAMKQIVTSTEPREFIEKMNGFIKK